jgi:putative endonuclease
VSVENNDQWLVYIVSCRDGTLYTGITNNLAARINAHNLGLGAKYTRPLSRRPVSVVYSAKCGSQSAAAVEEARIKKMSRSEKSFLLSNPRAPGAI